MLRDASDDGGRPVGFALEDLVVRGRRQVRRRRSGFAAVAGAAVVGLVAGGVTAVSSDRDRVAEPSGAGDVERCAALDRAFVEEVGADVPRIDDWSIQLRQSGDAADSLILASDSGRGYAYCRLDQTGGDTYDDYFRWGSRGGLDFDLTTGEDGHVVVTSAGDWTEGSLAFETADDVRSEPVWNGTYFIWQHEMDGVDPAAPVTATYYRPDGSIINSQNLNHPESWDDPQPDLPGVGGQIDDGEYRTRVGSHECWIEFGNNGKAVASHGGGYPECQALLKKLRPR